MVNKAIVVGRLGKDPEVKFTGNGKAVCNLSVATSESWTGQDGNRQERTEWHRVTAWGKTAENCGKFLSKGSLVFIEGRIQTRKYQDNAGNDRYTTEIVADNVRFLDSKREGGRRDDGDGYGGDYGGSGGAPADDPDSEIPFIVACDVSPTRRFRV